MGDLHAAQPHVIARRQSGGRRSRVPLRGSSRAGAGDRRRSASAMSAAVVSFMLRALPATSLTARPAHSASPASSVKSAASGGRGAAMRIEDRGVAERLRRLRAPQTVTVDGACDGAVSGGLLEGIADRLGGDGAGARVERGDQRRRSDRHRGTGAPHRE